MTTSVRAGSGFGDSVYLQSIVRHLVERGRSDMEVCTDYPQAFRPIADKIRLSPFRKKDVTCVAHYAPRKSEPGTDQFRDMCIAAGIREPVDLRLDWQTVEPDTERWFHGIDRPVIVVAMPRAPWGRTDGFGMELLPDCRRIQEAIDTIGRQAFFVQVGKGKPLFRFTGIDLDLANHTSLDGLIDVSFRADGFLGYCSYIIPLAESFLKPELCIWSRRGLNATHPNPKRARFVRTITPEKVFHRSSSRAVIDDCSDTELRRAANELLDQAAGSSRLRREVGGDRGERARVA